MDWIPTIFEGQGPLYLRIVAAIAADVASGRLVRGQQLPTHRALARALGVDLTTVTRAYGEARKRGLIDAQVGRGSFVSETTARAADGPPRVTIDLSMNIPPQPVEANLDLRIAQGLAAVRGDAGFSAFLSYARPGGSDEERQAGAAWLQQRIPPARAERLVVYPGAQAILFNILLTRTSPGDVVLTEAVTYPGLKAAAARLGVRLVGVAMDEEGVLPDALARACAAHKPKAVYLVPTQHNPTTATLGPARRQAVADIIARSDTVLIEDDAYGALEPQVAPIASLIPERTYYAASLSKVIAPALRVAYLLAPSDEAEQAMRSALQATAQMSASLMVALVTQWMMSGVAEQIIRAIRHEAAGRQQLAARYLAGTRVAARPHGHHLWVPLPPQWKREDLIVHLLRHGLAVVGGDAFAVSDDAPNGIRVSLGAARNRADLAQALQVLAFALKGPGSGAQIV